MDNNEQNPIVRLMNWLVDTLAKTLVSLFDGLKRAVDHSNPSLFALVATLLPLVLPLPVAFMTSHSAQTFFHWDAWAANTLGFGLEGLGFLVWVTLVESIIVKTQNDKVEEYVNFLWAVAIAYEVLLVFINVFLALHDGADLLYAVVLFLICLLPALSAAMYGIHRQRTMVALEREKKAITEQTEKERQEALAREEKVRQDRREDAMKRAQMKFQYNKDVDSPELNETPAGKKAVVSAKSKREN